MIIIWLRQSQGLSGAALAGVSGGLFAAVYAISAKIALKGIVYRRWTP